VAMRTLHESKKREIDVLGVRMGGEDRGREERTRVQGNLREGREGERKGQLWSLASFGDPFAKEYDGRVGIGKYRDE